MEAASYGIMSDGMSQQSHRSDPRILNRRTLQRDNPYLARVLRTGMEILDVGCGTGAITADIAKAVGPDGMALGIDRDDASLVVPFNNMEEWETCALKAQIF